MKKYKGYVLVKVYEDGLIDDLDHYFEIYKDGKFLTSALTYDNAKEFIDGGEDWNVLC